MITLTQGDAIQWARDYDGELFHAMFGDPPYHLTSITKRFSSVSAKPAKHGKDGAFRRASKGFMNQTWDGGDVAFQPDTWRAFKRVMYPGAFGMAFAGTRGAHRMAVAIEDAGFIIHPSIYWIFASGFPKATRVKNAPEFNGHRYGGQALKPAAEVIVVFQKPYSKRPVDDITRTGAGALNIEAGRIAHNDPEKTTQRLSPRYAGVMNSGVIGGRQSVLASADAKGRYPSNVIMGHHPDCELTDAGYVCVAGCAVLELDAQSGESISKTGGSSGTSFSVVASGGQRFDDRGWHNDSGGASRFYYQSDYMLERLENAASFWYCAKASTSEREAGLGEFDMQPANHAYGNGLNTETKIRTLDQSVNGVDRQKRRNIHATVKPISLTQYLASLLLPPVEYAERRLFVPFGGVASEMIGAMRAGWETVQGVELTPAYVPIGQARLEYWRNIPAGRKQPVKAQPAKPTEDGSRQLSLFDGTE